jgi:hypothetical protein
MTGRKDGFGMIQYKATIGFSECTVDLFWVRDSVPGMEEGFGMIQFKVTIGFSESTVDLFLVRFRAGNGGDLLYNSV